MAVTIERKYMKPDLVAVNKFLENKPVARLDAY